MSNEVIKLIQSHRSIRAFTDQEIREEQITDIVEAGRRAPTSHNVQAYSIVVIQDPKKKDELARLSGNQSYISKCPVFFVLIADFYRLKKASEIHEQPFEVGEVEQLLVGSVDCALVAENMLVASRSLGLGGVMIGGIRNNPEEVAKLLNLPEYTFPIMGLCIGYPDQNPDQKPRLPKGAIVFNENYDTDQVEAGLKEYDAVTEEYYRQRTNGLKTDSWSKQMATFSSNPKRSHVGDYVKGQGFLTAYHKKNS
ncbi:oxygen-insensitive NADPH nitroreductase [Alkalihalobacillus pseudalcaliphilus]|uniref:oxygen-insensitive NADPH nitroreductase n=1 Tax=Alkalihalobacillus pseudalcaliphilus TaxID=79884 RepID=UPI00064E0B9F|nr:oxygen-insensitive NADPH nitroreductase [Alkalihalobacillus pseudalcaliphilus]KMK75644.1 NADPH-flavin oxidoreductase [Alkalihalobacillus pseudalcaliphilus]